MRRNGAVQMELGPGYVPVRSLFCGVCSTDLARKFLPYPLPQIIGHEVVGEFDGRPVVVEINASHHARGVDEAHCPYCSGGMDTQCPDRITLGIDRLPGGFAPWFLAPAHALRYLPPGISPLLASLTEPFAAALQGVVATHPRAGESIAVLGPRRLGSLVLAALAGFRRSAGLDFRISALARHAPLLQLAARLGADAGVDLSHVSVDSLAGAFDVVFDTTGSPAGLADAVRLAKRAVHLKSTNGLPALGLKRLTDLVVHEIALIPFSRTCLGYAWPEEQAPRRNLNVFISPDLSPANRERLEALLREHAGATLHCLSADEAAQRIQTGAGAYPPDSQFPRFDLAVVDSAADADRALRPRADSELSLVRARGAIVIMPARGGSYADESDLLEAIATRGLELHSSRCGDFTRALEILAKNPEIAGALEKEMITQTLPLAEIEAAFRTAADSAASIKVVVATGAAQASSSGA